MDNHRSRYQSNVGHYPAGSYRSGTYDHGYAYGGLQAAPTNYNNQNEELDHDPTGTGPDDGWYDPDQIARNLGQRSMAPRFRGQVSHAGKGPVNYHRSDASIHDQVCEMLTDHDEIDASQVHVEVKDGEVTLTGTVLDRAMKRTADEVAGYAAGVKDVHNRLTIGPPSAV